MTPGTAAAGTEHLTHLYATAGDSASGSAATSRAVSAVSSKVCFEASADVDIARMLRLQHTRRRW